MATSEIGKKHRCNGEDFEVRNINEKTQRITFVRVCNGALFSAKYYKEAGFQCSNINYAGKRVPIATCDIIE